MGTSGEEESALWWCVGVAGGPIAVRVLRGFSCYARCAWLAGDYWPGEAENLLANLGEEQRQSGNKSGGGLALLLLCGGGCGAWVAGGACAGRRWVGGRCLWAGSGG